MSSVSLKTERIAVPLLDLKAQCRGAKYVEETLKLLPESPEPILMARIIAKITGIGRIHAPRADPVPT